MTNYLMSTHARRTRSWTVHIGLIAGDRITNGRIGGADGMKTTTGLPILNRDTVRRVPR